MGQQSHLPGPQATWWVNPHCLNPGVASPIPGMKWARAAGHFVCLINGPCVLPLETAGACWLCILVSMRSVTRGKSSDYSLAGDDIDRPSSSVHSFWHRASDIVTFHFYLVA